MNIRRFLRVRNGIIGNALNVGGQVGHLLDGGRERVGEKRKERFVEESEAGLEDQAWRTRGGL